MRVEPASTTAQTPLTPGRVAAMVLGPVLFGVIAGWLLGADSTAYTVISVLAAIGGTAAGFEHIGPGAGALRGVGGGAIYGAATLATNSFIGQAPESHLPDPHIGLMLIAAVAGAALGALGGSIRRARATKPQRGETQ